MDTLNILNKLKNEVFTDFDYPAIAQSIYDDGFYELNPPSGDGISIYVDVDMTIKGGFNWEEKIINDVIVYVSYYIEEENDSIDIPFSFDEERFYDEWSGFFDMSELSCDSLQSYYDEVLS